MLRKGSRYERTPRFAPDASGVRPFDGLRPRPIETTEGVVEHRVREGDRLDLLARHYYNNDRLWWRIVDANPDVLYAGDMVLGSETPRDPPDPDLAAMVGRVILIPRG